MKYITASELRTKSKNLVDSLKRGDSTNLVYKSRILAIVKPMREEIPKVIDRNFLGLLSKLSLNTITTKKEREQIYKKHLIDKYASK